MGITVERHERLEPAEQRAILVEANRWSLANAREALPEHAVFGLTEGPPVHHLLGSSSDHLLYAQGHPTSETLEFVALADRLPTELLDAAWSCCELAGVALSVWTRHVSAGSPAPDGAEALHVDREILRLAGTLAGRSAPTLPSDLTISAFRPGIDDGELLALNRQSFAAHPDQGSMSADDLRQRCQQPWFDPLGFLVLRRGHEMVAFCWTKVHRDPWGEVGEIYVIGVDPEAAGHGLGRLAVSAGLWHLARLGLDEVMLYVESDNAPARGLYASLGFSEAWRDRRWTSAP